MLRADEPAVLGRPLAGEEPPDLGLAARRCSYYRTFGEPEKVVWLGAPGLD